MAIWGTLQRKCEDFDVVTHQFSHLFSVIKSERIVSAEFSAHLPCCPPLQFKGVAFYWSR